MRMNDRLSVFRWSIQLNVVMLSIFSSRHLYDIFSACRQLPFIYFLIAVFIERISVFF